MSTKYLSITCYTVFMDGAKEIKEEESTEKLSFMYHNYL